MWCHRKVCVTPHKLNMSLCSIEPCVPMHVSVPHADDSDSSIQQETSSEEECESDSESEVKVQHNADCSNETNDLPGEVWILRKAIVFFSLPVAVNLHHI